MKKMIVLMQLLSCCGLAAQEPEIAAMKPSQKAQPSAAGSENLQGDEPILGMPMKGSYPASYNHPGNVSLSDGWDVYGDVSYLYWYTKQEGLDLATSGRQFDEEYFLPSTKNGYAIFQDSDYTSGFKVGLGANLNVDDWVADLTYTYLRQSTETASGPAPAVTVGTPAFQLTGWFYQFGYQEGVISSIFNSKWKFGLDWLDLMFKRPYYQGRQLVISPSAGLRGSWIRQHLAVSTPSGYSYNYSTPVPMTSSNYSNSWAIGPRALMDIRWLIGQGFRFQGNMGGSLLFTQYSHISHRESNLDSGGTLSGGVEFRVNNYNTIRAMAEANLGVGWGRYLYGKQYHVDFSATYDFNYLWNQNMMRYLSGISSISSGATGYAGDMILHGLELKGNFDF